MNSPAFIKMLILAFKITCILRLAIDRYISGAFGEDSLVPSCTYIITCITVMSMKCNLCKTITINAMVVVL